MRLLVHRFCTSKAQYRVSGGSTTAWGGRVVLGAHKRPRWFTGGQVLRQPRRAYSSQFQSTACRRGNRLCLVGHRGLVDKFDTRDQSTLVYLTSLMVPSATPTVSAPGSCVETLKTTAWDRTRRGQRRDVSGAPRGQRTRHRVPSAACVAHLPRPTVWRHGGFVGTLPRPTLSNVTSSPSAGLGVPARRHPCGGRVVATGSGSRWPRQRQQRSQLQLGGVGSFAT